MTTSILLQAENIAKKFGRRFIFSDIAFRLIAEQTLTVTGKNGSGKSTLFKIIAGVLLPSSGSVSITQNGSQVAIEDRFQLLGFVSPYIQLYDEFTAMEHLMFVRNVRGCDVPENELIHILEFVGLRHAKDDLVRTYSSGMKQRLKYASALVHKPPILLVDEPTSNLDAEGRAFVKEIIAQQRKRGVTLIATNVDEEISWGDQKINLNVTI